MKELNKLLYDILLKIEVQEESNFKPSKKLIVKYFKEIDNEKNDKFSDFESYFIKFYNFCFEIPLENMIREAIKFKY